MKNNLVEKRREDIIDACEHLYREKNFRDINIKEIGNVTSFTRTTIYNYFINKEEILLALFKREYKRWNKDLAMILSKDTLSDKEFAELVANSLDKRITLLHILSTNFGELDAMSREENIVDFKKTYAVTLNLFSKMLNKFFAEFSEDKKKEILMIFFPFLCGVYPYTQVTEKQKLAMQEAEVPYVYLTQNEIIKNCILNLIRKEV